MTRLQRLQSSLELLLEIEDLQVELGSIDLAIMFANEDLQNDALNEFKYQNLRKVNIQKDRIEQTLKVKAKEFISILNSDDELHHFFKREFTHLKKQAIIRLVARMKEVEE